MPRIAPSVALALTVFLLVFGALAWLGYLSDPGRDSPAGTARSTPVVVWPTPPPSGGPGAGIHVLVGAGDIADCSSTGDEATATLVDAIDGTVFTLGDNVYEDGSPDEFERCYAPSWGRPSILDRTMPTLGDHELRTANGAGYYAYFGPAAGDPRGYHAYDRGAWRIYVLNSNCEVIGGCAAGSAQYEWLRADLAANPRDCVVAMWHEPRFSSGPHGSNRLTEDLWAALYDANAELVLGGHDHHYERFAPQTATGAADDERGLVQFVVGTGGRFRRDLGEIRPHSVIRDAETWGVLRLTLAPQSWSSEFLPVAGQAFTDSATGTCH